MKLIATEGHLKGLVIDLEEKDNWTFGRDPDKCNFTLDDATVSRMHAKINKTSEGFILKNLSTTNPVEINDEVADEYLLNENDTIKIGNTYFLYTKEPEEALKEQPKIKKTKKEKVKEENETIFEEKEEELPIALITEAAFILKVVSGPNAGSEFGMEPGKSYIVGKDPNLCDIIFTDLSVSKQNAKITLEQKNIFIEDLNSKNGTFVNNVKVKEKTQIASRDLITLGTTTFLIVEKEAAQETIYYTPPVFKEKKVEVKEKKEELTKAEIWKKQFIPTRHLIFASTIIIIFFVIFLSFFGLFKSKHVEIAIKKPEEKIQKIIDNYENIQFSYNPSSSILFLLGHILTSVDKQELMYDLSQLDFIEKYDDNIIVDEYIWKDFNDTLNTQEDFRSVSIHSSKPGKFIMEGYVKTPDDFQKLTDYVNANFSYVDKLENKVVIMQILQMQIASKLNENNFTNVSFKIISGELVLAGRYDYKAEDTYKNLLEEFRKTLGIHSIKNLAISTSETEARIDLTQNYKISGSALYNGKNFSVAVNDKIITAGDILDGMKVTSITKNTILLEKDNLRYKINYTP